MSVWKVECVAKSENMENFLIDFSKKKIFWIKVGTLSKTERILKNLFTREGG